MFKKIVFLALICLSFNQELVFDWSKIVQDQGYAWFDDNIRSPDLIAQMGFGWNLGNTLDAHNGNFNEGLDSESSWGNPKVTNAMIDKLVYKGFKTIRLPVTWHNHIIDKKYTIDPAWMWRVKNVVDYCISKGLFVILNVHHDNADSTWFQPGAGYYPRWNNIDESKRFLANIWGQIARAFNNGYDHHLIFEALNEPRLIGDPNEWNYTPGDPSSEECVQVVNQLNYMIHWFIRDTGGNNLKRFILFTNGAAGFTYVTANGFYLPDDSKYNPTNTKILVSVHLYSPYDFALDPNMSVNSFTEAHANELEYLFQTLKKKYTDKGFHVVVTEMGATDKLNTEGRKWWGEFFVRRARELQMACVVWDNNRWNTNWDANEKLGLFHREKGTFESDDYVNTLINDAKPKY